MSEDYQVVMRQGRPYIRRRPYTYEHPTLRQQVHQGRLAKVAYGQFDQAKGYENGIPIVAAKVKEELTGRTVPQPPRILELTPGQYAALLDNIRRRQLAGQRIVLSEILERSNMRIKIVAPVEVPIAAIE